MSTIASAMPAVPPAVSGWIPSPLYRMSVEEYERMVVMGALKERPRLQLIHGLLVEKTISSPPHAVADALCGHELGRVMPPGWSVRSSKPVRLAAQVSEPEPDQCVVRGVPRDYLAGHPGPRDIGLVVEVADSSLAEDRELGTRVYGPAGLPVYWIINLNDRQVEVYTDPGPAGYTSRRDYRAGAVIPVVIAAHPVGQVAVDDILP